jgi:peptide/nickel transport system substrate-binding protein
MIKSLRSQVWYIRSFLQKYFLQIFFGLFVSIGLAFLFNSFLSSRPNTKRVITIGLVGQYTPSNLPSLVNNIIGGGLTYVDEAGQVSPNLAQSFDIDSSELKYTFLLKSDLKWSDGRSVTSFDLKLNVPSVKVETPDPQTISFTLPTKYAPFPSLLTFPLVDNNGQTISGWQIQVKQRTSGILSQISLSSSTQDIIINLYPNYNQASTAFKLGEMDLLYQVTQDYMSEIESYGHIDIYNNYKRAVMLYFNFQDPQLKSKEIRQSIAYALSDKSHGRQPASSTISPSSWAYNPLTKDYSYNRAKAKTVLDKPIELEMATLPELLDIAESIAKQLLEVDVVVNIKVVNSPSEISSLLLSYYDIPPDPDQYRDWHSTQNTNITGVQNERLDKLLEDGRTTLDIKERKSIYFDFQRTFMEELPALPLYFPEVFNIAKKQVYLDIIKGL